MNAYYLLLFTKGLAAPVCSHRSFPAWETPSRLSYSGVRGGGPHASPLAGQQRLYLQLASSGATPWLSVLLAQGQGLLLSR